MDRQTDRISRDFSLCREEDGDNLRIKIFIEWGKQHGQLSSAFFIQ